MSKVNARKEGDDARDRRDWAAAARAYRNHLLSHDDDAAIWVQLGHALKEGMDYLGAESAYKQALSFLPNDSDVPLQMGHLMKLAGRRSEAVAYYLASLRLDHRSSAQNELYSLGQAATADKIVKSARITSSSKVCYFQINDLLYFLRDHRTPSGIQRVQLGILIYTLQRNNQANEVEFVYNNRDDIRIWLINREKLTLVVDYLNEIDVDQEVLRSKIDDVMSSRICVNPGAGDAFIILGAFWMLPFNTVLLSKLKKLGASIGIYIYDLIPIVFPEYCNSQLTIDFTMDLVESLVLIDFAIAISQHTAEEVSKFISDNAMRPIPIEVVPLAHTLTGTRDVIVSTALESDWSSSTEILKGEKFVLCVCTIEPRKNHRYLYDIWKSLKAEGIDVPKLVFVGRRGWNMGDFFVQMENSRYLDGDVVVVHDLSDTELATLYANCLFTAFPSIVEGWGLPVGESLYYGKLCIASNTSSMPEVGGNLVEYIDPLNVRSAVKVFRDFIQNPEWVAKWENRIRKEFVPRSWDAVAEDFCNVAARLAKATPINTFVFPATRAGHVVEIGRFARGPQPLHIEEMLSLERLTFGDDFYPPESFGAWMKGAEGRLHISTNLSSSSRVIVFAELEGAPDISNMRVEIIGVKSKTCIAKLTAGRPTLIKIETETDEDGIALVRFKLLDVFDRERYLPRVFAIALHSYAYAKWDDIVARMAITESYVFKMQSS